MVVAEKQTTESFKTHVNYGFGLQGWFEKVEHSVWTTAETTLVNDDKHNSSEQ